jgi:type I restriction enzyme S subunit
VSEWQEVTVAEIAANSPNSLATGPFGSAISSRFFCDSGVPVIRGSNLSENVGERLIHEDLVFVSEEKANEFRRSIARKGDLVFTCWGTIGQVGLIDDRCAYDEYVISNKQMKLSPDASKTDSLFLYYLFSGPEVSEQIRAQAIGSSVPGFNLGQLRSIRLRIPPLPEQRAIASVLGALDDKIELNRRMNETLEALAQSLFHSWFVAPTQAGLPKGWRWAKIAELCKLNAWTLGKDDELDRIEYVEISEVTRGSIANIQVFPRGEEPSRARRRLRHGDTVLSTVRPDRGSYFLCLNPSTHLIASTGFAVVTPTKTPWSFIHAALTHPEVFEHLGQQADGGAYPAVRPEIIGNWEVPWPDKAGKVEEFHRACAPLYERAEHNRCESRTLAVLRDTLLPKLLSGQIRVRNVERSVGRYV